jgi:predicted hydrocarbon binding protein
MGMCKGIADAVIGRPHFVYEKACIANGKEFCEIVLARSGTDSRDVDRSIGGGVH